MNAKRWMIAVLICAVSALAQAALEEWAFDTEVNGTSFTNLVNSGTEGAAHFGEDHAGTYVTNGALRFTSDAVEDCYRIGELTTSNLDTGIYELHCNYSYTNLTVNNTAFGVFLRSKETYTAISKSSTDLFQLRIHVVSGIPTIQTRVLQPDDNAGIVDHFALPTSATDVDVRLTVDLVNDTLDGVVVYNGTTNTFSRLMLDLPADYIRVHGTPTKFAGTEYVEMDDIQWSFVSDSEPQDVVFIEYTMDTETNGTTLGQLEQTGVDSASWSSAATAAGVVADGEGNLLFSNVTANAYKNYTLGSPISNAVVELEYNLSGWEFNGLSEATANNFAFELRDLGVANETIKISLDYKVAEGTRINWIPSVGDKPRQTLGITGGTNLTVKMQIDLINGTFAAFYNLGNGWIKKAENQSIGNITQLDDFRLIVDGTDAWGATAFAKVDYIRVKILKPKKLIDFQFDDAVNTDLKDLWNDGSITTNWNFNATGDIFADGNGNLELQDISTNYTRKVALGAVALTNDTVTMDWRLDAWEVGGLAASDGFNFTLKDTVSNRTVKGVFNLTGDASDTRITMTDVSGQGKQQAGLGLTNGADGVTFRIVANLEDETFKGYYKMDSGTWTEVTTTNNAGLSRIDEISLNVNPTWTGTGFIDVDYLTVVSETNAPTGGDTPDSLYNDWIGGQSGSGGTGLLDDINEDGVNNLVDYAIGGAANLPVSAIDGDFLMFVHVRWNDAEALSRGLTYTVEANGDLTAAGGWATNGVELVGIALDTPEAGYNTVTSQVEIVDSEEFVRLKVEFTSP